MDLTGPADHPPRGGFPPPLWESISHAPHRLLMLDHDGTLVPFEIVRGRAIPARETLALLERIAASAATTLAVISGRPVRELADLLAHPTWTLVGEHGWEVRDDGPVVRHPLPRGAATGLDRAERMARERGFGERLERKRASLAVHTRGLEPAHAREIETTAVRLWSTLTDGAPLRLAPFHGGMELRALGRDKGTAVRDLLVRERPGTLGVYLGDDQTDEDGFRALEPAGIGVRVGPAVAASAALASLAGPEEVARFLERWLEVTERDPRARA